MNPSRHSSIRSSDRLGVVVLMRSFHPFSGGAETQALRLAEAMRARNVDVGVVTQRRGSLPYTEVHHGVSIHRMRTLERGHLAALAFLVTSFAWLFRHRHEIDVIHANRTTSGLIAGLTGLVLRLPVVCKLTGGAEIADKGFRDTRLGRLKMRVLRRTVTRFVAITAAIERELVATGVPREQIVRIPNGIEPRSASPGATSTRPKLGIAANAPVATFVGRLIPEKCVDRLLEAWQAVASARPDARLLIVGDGPHRKALGEKAVALGITGSVLFLGHRPNVEQLLHASDVFVLPSLREGMSNALLEAMAAGRAVVASDDLAGGNREIVTSEQDGLVVPVGNAPALASAILRLFADPPLRRRLGERAKETVSRRFSIETVTDRYLSLYQDVLAARLSSRREVAVVP
jgi:glycosyltransferase involved in cell wall biosynthesis